MSLLRKLMRGTSGLPEPPARLLEAFEPATDLERALATFAAGGASDAGPVLQALASARLFVPSRRDPAALQEGDAFAPILLEYDAGPCVVACTSGARVKGLLASVPEVEGGLDVEARWVLAQCGDGVGLALNPGWSEGIVIPASEVVRLRG